jgi:peptide/nickel transport system permease protein
LGFLSRRLGSAALTLVGVSALAFLATALVPGNPATILLGTEASPAQIAAVTHQMGLDKLLWVRYLIWLREVLKGDLGQSIFSKQLVVHLLAQALPVTLELTLLSVLVALVIAVPLGLLLADHSAARWTRAAMFAVSLGISVPGFWLGLMLIILFAVKLHILPAGGYTPFTEDPAANLEAMVMPVLALSLYLAPPLVRFLRATAIGVLREDYVKAARAKGLRGRQLMIQHVAPNALIPAVTYLGLQLGGLISGAIVTEVIFSLPGMGRLGLSAILGRDYPVVQGVVLVVAGGYVLINLLVDVLYGIIDPRVRTR